MGYNGRGGADVKPAVAWRQSALGYAKPRRGLVPAPAAASLATRVTAVSKNAMEFLTRQKLVQGKRHMPHYGLNTIHSHTRPVWHLPDLLPPDRPQGRVLTQKERDRVPYVGDKGCCGTVRIGS